MEFEFDLGSDTAISVASEMVEEMSLSHTDAARIAQAIKEEIFFLTHKGPGSNHRAAPSYCSVSDDESNPPRPPPSEGGLTAASDGVLHEAGIPEVKYEASSFILEMLLGRVIGSLCVNLHLAVKFFSWDCSMCLAFSVWQRNLPRAEPQIDLMTTSRLPFTWARLIHLPFIFPGLPGELHTARPPSYSTFKNELLQPFISKSHLVYR